MPGIKMLSYEKSKLHDAKVEFTKQVASDEQRR